MTAPTLDEPATETASNDTDDTDDTNLIVVIDGYNDWVPIAALYDADEAIKLQSMLRKDGESTIDTAPYYETKEDAREDNPTAPPDDLDDLVVAWEGTTVKGVSEDDWAAREVSIREGGFRTGVSVYDTAEAVAEDKPEVTGAFIDAETTADDLLDELE